LKILHLISSTGLYGAERFVIVLSIALKSREFHPIIGVIKNQHNPNTDIADLALHNGLDTVIFPCFRQFDLRLIFLIRSYIEQNKIKLIHCHNYKSNFFGILAARKCLPKVTTNHNWLKNSWRNNIYCLLDSLLIRNFDKIIAVSDKIKDEMIVKGIPEKKIQVVNNGIDLERFREEKKPKKIRKEFCFTNNEFIIGTIGNLNREKGHFYLIEAAKIIVRNFSNVKFLIIGDGNLKKKLSSQVNKYGLKNKFFFTGYRSDIPELLSIIDIFILPSINEGLPMVLLEAMAAKKPIIATRVGAVPKVIDNNLNGILVNARNSSELAIAISKIIKNPSKGEKMARNALQKVKFEFSSEILCDKYVNIYRNLK
jgi:glycosyltransferase involved in cell wall biosynthesis